MENKKQLLRQVARHGAIGMEMAISVVIGMALGWWLDKLFNTKPWLSLVGMLFGFAAGFRSLFRLVKEVKDNGGISQE